MLATMLKVITLINTIINIIIRFEQDKSISILPTPMQKR